MSYVILEGDDYPELESKVLNLLDHGWKPQGGVAVRGAESRDGYTDRGSSYYQAMVKVENRKD